MNFNDYSSTFQLSTHVRRILHVQICPVVRCCSWGRRRSAPPTDPHRRRPQLLRAQRRCTCEVCSSRPPRFGRHVHPHPFLLRRTASNWRHRRQPNVRGGRRAAPAAYRHAFTTARRGVLAEGSPTARGGPATTTAAVQRRRRWRRGGAVICHQFLRAAAVEQR